MYFSSIILCIVSVSHGKTVQEQRLPSHLTRGQDLLLTSKVSSHNWPVNFEGILLRDCWNSMETAMELGSKAGVRLLRQRVSVVHERAMPNNY